MIDPTAPEPEGLRAAVEALLCLCHEALCPVHNEAAGRVAEYDVPSLMDAITTALLAASEADRATAGEREAWDFDTVADMDESRNVFDITDELARRIVADLPATPPADNASECGVCGRPDCANSQHVLASRYADAVEATMPAADTPDATSEAGCRWSDARGRWEWQIRPGVSKEACGHLAHTRGDDLYMPDERPTVLADREEGK